ncbi:MAG: hypothetical protein IH987_12645 [Planctomycetes bacterium]|nr:hypothetical protein [Planctomycetota bacterium]
MGRPHRVTQAGLVYHVLNRRVMRLPVFQEEVHRWCARMFRGLLPWCLMPNHWQLVVQAGKDTNLSTWMQWVARRLGLDTALRARGRPRKDRQ